MNVTLAPVVEAEYGDFAKMAEPYHYELDPYDPIGGGEPFSAEQYRRSLLADTEERELLWIIADGERAGFAIVRTWPDGVAEVIEFYVVPALRRRGVGRAAVEALLAEHRRRGTALVEAGILGDNEPAKAFWAALGFQVRSLRTARRP